MLQIQLIDARTVFIKSKGGQAMEDMLTMIANTGFSIVVAVYLLVRMEKRMCELRESISELAVTIRKVSE